MTRTAKPSASSQHNSTTAHYVQFMNSLKFSWVIFLTKTITQLAFVSWGWNWKLNARYSNLISKNEQTVYQTNSYHKIIQLRQHHKNLHELSVCASSLDKLLIRKSNGQSDLKNSINSLRLIVPLWHSGRILHLS